MNKNKHILQVHLPPDDYDLVNPPTWTPYPALTHWYIRRADLTFTKEGFHEPRPIEGE